MTRSARHASDRKHGGPRSTVGRGLAAATAVAITSAIGLGAAAPAALAADACANARFRVGWSLNLPDCRAYEQVSPVNKNGAAVKMPTGTTVLPSWASADGRQIMFESVQGAFNDVGTRGIGLPYTAGRTEHGWSVSNVLYGPDPGVEIDAAQSIVYRGIPDAARRSLIFSSSTGWAAGYPAVRPSNSAGLFRARPGTIDWLSTPTWAGATPTPGTNGFASTFFIPVAATDDHSTVYFISYAKLMPEDATRISTRNTSALYRWHDGVLSHAGVLPDGTIPDDGTLAAGQVIGNGSSTNYLEDLYQYSNSVSRDGNSALFMSPDPNSQSTATPHLYLARPGQRTIMLDKRVADADADPAAHGITTTGALRSSGASRVFAVADPDHTRIVFSTRDALTVGAPDDSVLKTYLYRPGAADPLTRLDELDQPWAGEVAAFGPIIKFSDDGSRLLYLSADGELRIWRDGLPSLTISRNVPPTAILALSNSTGVTQARFSADGQTLVFESFTALDGAVDHPAGSSLQVYRYTEADGNLDCMSCPPMATAVKGAATFSGSATANGVYTNSGSMAMTPRRGISDDGTRVFFTSNSSLSPDDYNDKADVYQWHEGRVSLLSSGTSSSQGEFLADNSASGDDVFITTDQRLVPGDQDDSYDIYDVRVGGGLAGEQTAARCEGDACQGAPSSAPESTDAGTARYRGAGNLTPAPARPALKVSAARKTVVGRSFVVVVRNAGAGKIVVSGARLKRTARKTTGSVRIKVALSRKGRKALKQRKRLKVVARVRVVPRSGSATTKVVRVTLKQPAARKGR